jgi:hypothetical protein
MRALGRRVPSRSTHAARGNRGWIAGLLVATLALAPSFARANSVLSIGGLGEPQLEEAARQRALGGAGAAEHGPRDISLVNPASLADVERILLQVTVLPTIRKVGATGLESETANETTFPSARAVIALPGRIVLGGAYVAGTDAEFTVVRQETAGAPSTIKVEGSGGINFLRVSFARRVAPAFRLGVDWEAISGSYHETWLRTFSDSGLVAARDTVEVTYSKKGRWRFGAQVVKEDWTLGGVFETAQDLSLNQRSTTTGGALVSSGVILEIPSGFTVGASAPLGGRYRAVGQYRRQNWSRSSLQSNLVDFRALQRFSVGFERKRDPAEGGSLWHRTPLRIGGYLLQWPDLLPRAGASDLSGGSAEVNERALTLGVGFGTKDQGGALDLSLELGTRGDQSDLGVDEKFARFGVSFLVSDETWRGGFHR